MRSSLLLSAAFAAGTLAAPLAHDNLAGRAYVTQTVIEDVTVTVTVHAGAAPESTSATSSTPAAHSVNHHTLKHSSSSSSATPPKTTSTRPVVVVTTIKPSLHTRSSTSTPTSSSKPAASSNTDALTFSAKAAWSGSTYTGGGPLPATDPVDGKAIPQYAWPVPRVAANGSPITGGKAIIDVINEWRTTYQLPSVAYNAQLEANAQITARLTSDGTALVHELNTHTTPGTWGQIEASGIFEGPLQSVTNYTPFEATFVGEWLCERMSDSQLAGKCPGSKNGDSADQDHYKIILTAGYTQVGCFFVNDGGETTQGLWICDWGYYLS